MLKVGQIRKNVGTQYLRDLSSSFTPTKVYIKGFDGKKVFHEFALTLNDGNFVANTTYYLRVAIKRTIVPPETIIDLDRDRVQFQVKLYQKDGQSGGGSHDKEKIQTLASNGVVDYYTGTNGEWMQYNLIFVPNDTYKYLCFEVTRNGYDYITKVRNPFILGNEPVPGEDTLDFGTDGDFAIVNNILPAAHKMSKIGIQSRPGSMFVVNREPIILGRSGVYEINNGTKITSVGVVAPNGTDTSNIQDFLLDYGYDNSSEEA